MAVYTSALMLQGGDLTATVYIIRKAGFAIGLWGAAAVGWFMGRLAWWERLPAMVAQHLWRAGRPGLAGT